MYHQLYFLPPLSCFHAHLLALNHIYIYIMHAYKHAHVHNQYSVNQHTEK